MTTAKSGKNSDWPGGGTIGIHGTNQPWLLPGRPSHGCVRLENKDDEYLYKHAPVGTPVKIV
jgi:lipoprotein-anchoring transpeptidase ErfK/SrfK